jgi:uncharacterized protein
MSFSDSLGTLGVSLLLLAFLGNLFHYLPQSHWLYTLLNFIGAGLAAYTAVLIEFVPFVILEGTWALVSLIALSKKIIKKPDNQRLSFEVLPNAYALCRLDAQAPIPDWVFASPFYTISKSEHELSLVCEERWVNEPIKAEKNWKLLRINSTLDLSLAGITAQFSSSLAQKKVNICVIATYDTDYLLVKSEKLRLAKTALREAGFKVID